MTVAPHHDPSGEHEGVGHVAPLRALLGTGAGLLTLTGLTVYVASIDLGELNVFIALAIAVIKSSLVALFFMHLRWDRPFHGIVFVTAIAFVGLFLALAMTDTAEYEGDVIGGDAPSVVQAIEANP